MKIKLIAVLALAMALSCQVFAVIVKKDQIKNKSVFGISFPSGNSLYMTSMSVSSISKHSYISGAIHVTELVIDSLGGTSQMRIYHVAPADALGAAKDAGANLPGRLSNITNAAERLEAAQSAIMQKTGAQVPTTDQVFKQYPNATHAHTVEYAVDSAEEIDNLFQALIKDYAGSDTKYKSDTAKDKATENMPDKNTLGGKLYEVQSAKELADAKK